MGAKTKRAQKVRPASDFSATRILAELMPPRMTAGSMSWSLAEIVNARDAQMVGHFKLAARLAESMRTDDAIHVARGNRLAPLRCIKVKLQAAKGARGTSIAAEAEGSFGQNGIGIAPDTMHDIHDCLVVHSVAFAVIIPTPRDDGSRVDYAVKYWPIEWVYWFPIERCYMTQTEGGQLEKITHGDGRWIVFQDGEYEPFKNGAILAASMVWARHALALRDWAKGSVAHGSAKVVGEMPTGTALQKTDASGNTVASDEAVAFSALLRAFASDDAPVGLRPAGAKTEFLTNTSTAWQVFAELVGNAEKSAARIFLGTDGVLGAQGGAPGVDISALFGVATTKVQGDIAAIERGLQTGLIEVWTAVNFGDSSLAPYRRYQIPDADADAVRAAETVRRAAFYAEVALARENGVAITQAFFDGLAAAHGIPSPTLDAISMAGPSSSLTTKEVAGIVITVNEARASASLGPLTMADGVTPDPRGLMTIGEFNSGIIAKADVATTPAASGAAPPAALRAV